MKLTAIVPTFNRAQLLSEAINSLLSQTPVIGEIIIVDDASTDETQKLCKRLQEKQFPTSISVIRNNQNLGAQVSRNLGLEVSTGDAILFMDSDDVLTKNGVEVLLHELENDRNLDYVYGQVLRTNSKLQPLKNSEPIGSSFSDRPDEIAGYHWHTMGAIYRREYLKKVGVWNEGLTGSQDWEFQARVKLAKGKGKFVEHIVGLWRDHADERVGSKNFRYDYVESVINACLLIRDKSREVGVADASLERRLAKKILLHGLEFAVNGYRQERCQSLSHAVETLQNNQVMKLIVLFWQILSSNFDSILWEIIQLSYLIKYQH